jgi:hypothetical protein
MDGQDQAELKMMVARLRQDHDDYGVAIESMIKCSCDFLQIQRMKKKKLALKDRIAKMESRIIPDIIA